MKSTALGIVESCSEQLYSDLIYHARRYQFSCLIRKHYRKELIFLGASEAQRKQDFFIERASQAELPVLILGENGCEQEYVAYALHLASTRMDSSFVVCDCLTGEYNGRDAFHFEMRQAQGGSLFLKNVDALSLKGQLALGEILSEISAEDHARPRIIATSPADIHAASQRKEFYAPLLRYLDFLCTTLVPLRSRPEDIRLLNEFFLLKYSGDSQVKLSDKVMQSLDAFDWVGNVDQLEKVIARLVVLRKGMQIELADLDQCVPEIAMAQGSDGRRSFPRSAERVQHLQPRVAYHLVKFLGEDGIAIVNQEPAVVTRGCFAELLHCTFLVQGQLLTQEDVLGATKAERA